METILLLPPSNVYHGWALGLSRAMDYLEQEPAVDAKRVAVMGHSRLGKTALWAGAQDERFAIVISNNSGEGGASLVRRRFGEAIHHSVSMVPYWYCTRYRQYAWHEACQQFQVIIPQTCQDLA